MSTETTTTTMTQAAATTDGATASVQATNQPAAAAGEGAQQQQQQATQGQASQGQQSDAGAKPASEQGKPQQGAPESYEFKAPEGKEFSPETLGAFAEAAKESGLTQESAQKMLDKIAPAFAQRQAQAVEAARAQWATESQGDKEFGGAKLTENLGIAKKALDAFATPELRTLLDQSGLGNHPEIIRLLFRAGKAISEDRFVSGQGGNPKQGDARRLYAASNMNP